MTASNQSRQVQQTIGSAQQQMTKTIIIQQQPQGQPQTIQLQTPPKVSSIRLFHLKNELFLEYFHKMSLL